MNKNRQQVDLAASISMALHDPNSHFYKPQTDEWPEDEAGKLKREFYLRHVVDKPKPKVTDGGYLATFRRVKNAIMRGFRYQVSQNRQQGKSLFHSNMRQRG